MLFAVLFSDRLEKRSVRQAQMKAHLQFLARNQKTILVAGSLRTTPDAAAKGGLWIVAAKDRESVENLLARDPFYKHGLRKKITIRHWSKAFARKRLV